MNGTANLLEFFSGLHAPYYVLRTWSIISSRPALVETSDRLSILAIAYSTPYSDKVRLESEICASGDKRCRQEAEKAGYAAFQKRTICRRSH